MQTCHLKCHPFVACSYLNPGRQGESEESDDGEALGTDPPAHADRRADFIIDDSPTAGPACFRATKNLAAPQSKDPEKMTALAVREFGTKKHSKVLRFIHSLPSIADKNTMTWSALPYTSDLSRQLFNTKDKYGRILMLEDGEDEVKQSTESMLLDDVFVLTVSQRCADWFMLRQFRITATTAAKLLLRDEEYRKFMNLPSSDTTPLTTEEVQTLLFNSWFSRTRSTEPMTRGTVNESAVLSLFAKKSFVVDVWHIGLVAVRTVPWMAASPDGVAVFKALNGMDKYLSPQEDGDTGEYVACVGIKTSVADSSVQRATELATADVITCRFGDELCNKYIPKEHAAQIVHQASVLNTSLCFYIMASESQILYVVLVTMSLPIMRIVANAIWKHRSVVEWAHSQTPSPHGFLKPEHARTVESMFPFWRYLNSDVLYKGPFVPVRVFRHSIQTMYSKTKGGVDGNAQARAIMRCPTDSLQWVQKITTQVLKGISVNAWISWRMLQKEDLTENVETFHSLDFYRHSLNKVQSLADFVHDLTYELLEKAEQIHKEGNADVGEAQLKRNAIIGKREAARLTKLAQNKQRYRLDFFNSPDGTKLRLVLKGHDHVRMEKELYCVLCGQNKDTVNKFRGHRSSTKCQQCDVSLCIKAHQGFRRSCWDVWHSVQRLKRRVPIGNHRKGETPESEIDGRQSPITRQAAKRKSREAQQEERPSKRKKITTRKFNKRRKSNYKKNSSSNHSCRVNQS